MVQRDVMIRSSRQNGRRSASRKAPRVSVRAQGWSGFLRTNASAFTFLGITLGVFVSRKFLALPLAVAAMVVQDAVKSTVESAARRSASF